MRTEKGQAGLNILLSVVTMLFLLGMIIMIYVYSGSKLEDAVATTTTVNVGNETITTLTEVARNLAYYGYWEVACSNFIVTNASSGATVPATNYTGGGGCTIAIKTASVSNWNATTVNVSYTATHKTYSDDVLVINKTKQAIGSTVDWFDIIVVMSALVVLVLLIVLIVRAIKTTGIEKGA